MRRSNRLRYLYAYEGDTFSDIALVPKRMLMSHRNPLKVVEPISDILSACIDEYRPLNLGERFKIDGYFESLFRSDKSLYYATYSSYAALIGDIKGIDDCYNYFFAAGSGSLTEESIQCLFSLNNSSYFEKLLSTLDYLRGFSSSDLDEGELKQLFQIYINASLNTLNLSVAERLLESLSSCSVDGECIEKNRMRLGAANDFLSHYTIEEQGVIRDYLCEVLKVHRENILSKIYKVAGPSIMHSSFFNDEGRAYIAIIFSYVSDDVDYAIELEEFFYDKIHSNKIDSIALSAVAYNILPVSTKDSSPFAQHVVEFGSCDDFL